MLKWLYLTALVHNTWQMRSKPASQSEPLITHLTFSSLRGGAGVHSYHKSIRQWRLVDPELDVMVERIHKALWSKWRCAVPCSFGVLLNNGVIEDLQWTPDTACPCCEDRKSSSLCVFFCALLPSGTYMTFFMTQSHSHPLSLTVNMVIAQARWSLLLV